MPAVLRQLDPHGARLRLLDSDTPVSGDLCIVTSNGDELFGASSWRIGDTIGVKRHARNAARLKALGLLHGSVF